MVRINEIIDKVSSYLSEADILLIQKAYVFAAAKHSGQVRLSGEPYLSHPLEVANILADLRLDAATITAGLLHDIIEDTDVTLEELKEKFGSEVAKLVDGVTKIERMDFSTREERLAENVRKMILAMSDDIRVIFIKLADRLHNMRTLGFHNGIKQRLISQETLDIYSPIANRLGLYKIKRELDDLSLKYLKPEVYNQIKQRIEELKPEGEKYIQKIIKELTQLLKENSIKGKVSGRIKGIYSIYNKMQRQNITLDEVYDIIAFRVIVESVKDCYAILGLIHGKWTPIDRFKDYISRPKPNMYQSLHTTVIGPEGKPLEIQIRTTSMHQLAEYGIAAHWKYKENTPFSPKDERIYTWVKQILDWEREAKDPREFLAGLKMNLFDDEIYVFTPKGDVIKLPAGATPVDFAYAIHTEVGHRCAGAKVNGKLVPLDTPLKSGDKVEIITRPNHKPSRDWLNFVKTSKARAKIRHWFNIEERASSIALAKEILEKEAKKLGLDFNQLLNNGKLEEIAHEFSFKNVDDLLCAVGYAKLTPGQVLSKLEKKEEIKKEKEEESEEEKKHREVKVYSDGVCIGGSSDFLITFAKCCLPVPGEPIVGYIKTGKGLVVHSADCPNIRSLDPNRLISVRWDEKDEKVYPVTIKILCKNKKGVLAKIATLLANEDINIVSGNFKPIIDEKMEFFCQIEVKDAMQLYNTIDKLTKIEDVIEVTRVKGEIPTKQQGDIYV